MNPPSEIGQPLPGPGRWRAEGSVRTYTAGRRLKINEQWREVGEPVPEAHGWMRVEEWAHTGHLREVEISEDEFRSNLQNLVPAEQHDELLEKAKVTVTRKAAPTSPQRLKTKARARKD